MATEYVEGESLRQHMARSRPELRRVLNIATRMADALSAAREAGNAPRVLESDC